MKNDNILYLLNNISYLLIGIIIGLLILITIYLFTKYNNDSNDSDNYINLKINYVNKDNELNTVLGIISEKEAKKINREHEKISVYIIGEINTDDISSIVLD